MTRRIKWDEVAAMVARVISMGYNLVKLLACHTNGADNNTAMEPGRTRFTMIFFFVNLIHNEICTYDR
jgi:hypothetical protein